MAKPASTISGTQDVINEIMMQKHAILKRVAVAVEKTAVDVSNHAKANHIRGVAHSQGRFEVDTGTLVRSITPKLEKVNFKEVTAIVFTNIEYAIPVEFGTVKTRAYPYMFPALIANQGNLIRRLKAAGA